MKNSKLKGELILFVIGQGRVQEFHLGGVQKVVCEHAHYERGTELTFGRGPLSCNLSLIFKHSD